MHAPAKILESCERIARLARDQNRDMPLAYGRMLRPSAVAPSPSCCRLMRRSARAIGCTRNAQPAGRPP